MEEGVEDSEAVAINRRSVPFGEGLPEFPAALFCLVRVVSGLALQG